MEISLIFTINRNKSIIFSEKELTQFRDKIFSTLFENRFVNLNPINENFSRENNEMTMEFIYYLPLEHGNLTELIVDGVIALANFIENNHAHLEFTYSFKS